MSELSASPQRLQRGHEEWYSRPQTGHFQNVGIAVEGEGQSQMRLECRPSPLGALLMRRSLRDDLVD
jgi:hypothetical protein